MKRYVLLAVFGLLALLIVAAFFVIRDVRSYSHDLCSLQDAKRLAIVVESFRADQSRYPTSLNDLETESASWQKKELAKLHQHLDGTWDYVPLPSGFRLTIHGERCGFEHLTNDYSFVVGKKAYHGL